MGSHQVPKEALYPRDPVVSVAWIIFLSSAAFQCMSRLESECTFLACGVQEKMYIHYLKIILYIYIPRTQMTLVLIGKGFVLGC